MKTLKIVHCANFSESKFGQVFYSIDRKITNGLIRNGHFVYDFSYREIAKNATFLKKKKLGAKKMNEKLIDTVNTITPDLLLLGHSELIDASTLKRIKASFPDIKIAMWWVDWLKNLSSIVSKMKYLDTVFITTGMSDFDINLILDKKTKISYFPNMCDSSIEVYKSFENDQYSRDVFFAGRLDTYRENFLINLKQILDKNIKFEIFGNLKDTLLLGNEFLKQISKSKISLNLSRDHDSSLYTSDRIIQLLANGSMVISKKIPDFEILFNDDEIVFFDDIVECKDKIDFYLHHDKERKEIAFNGWKKAHQSYNSTRVTKYMLETIFELEYTEDYEWKSQSIKSDMM